MSNMGVKSTDFNTSNTPTWCPGCGNFTIQIALKNALSELNISPSEVMISFDIGCNGNGAGTISGYGFKGLHGRSIPLAVGAHLANRRFTVISDIGDGGVLHEGIEHLIHGIRSNYDITVIIHNNQNFALTTGQATATTQDGKPMYALPDGKPEQSLGIGNLVLSLNPSFYARGFSGDPVQLAQILKAGIKHKGFSVIEVMQVCPTYNPECDMKWFASKIKKMDVISDIQKAIELVNNKESLYTGVIYQNKTTPSFLDRLENRKGKKKELVDEVKTYNIKNILSKFE